MRASFPRVRVPVPLDLYTNIRDQRLAALRDEFFPRLPLAESRPLTLEIGCGHGHYLTAFAAEHPEEYCVGIDLLADRIERAERKARRAKLANLAFVQAEASLFLSALAAGSGTGVPPVFGGEASRPAAAVISTAEPSGETPAPPQTPSPPAPAVRLRRVFVLFSDPWPKRRHWKHRVLQSKLLDALAGMALPGAKLHFRTDHPEYFDFAREVITGHPRWRLAAPGEEPWPFEYVSVFEERALAGAPQSLTAVFA